jgi:ribosomal protein L29
MDIKELRTQSAEALEKTAAEYRAKIRDLRFAVGTRSRANVRDLRKAKKDLARVLTVKHSL